MEILIPLGVLLFSAILHEVMHGVVADKLGDPTARLMGRLTLDPRKHIDPMYRILFPLILAMSGLPVIAAAKPVPIDAFNLKEGRKDIALVSLAGPLTNIVLALIFFIAFLFFKEGILGLFFNYGLTINSLLALFNNFSAAEKSTGQDSTFNRSASGMSFLILTQVPFKNLMLSPEHIGHKSAPFFHFLAKFMR